MTVFLSLVVPQGTTLPPSHLGTGGGLRQHLCSDTEAGGVRGLKAGPHGERSESFFVAQVLQQMPSPAGPMLYLSPTFASRDNQEKLEQFIRQFICG